MKRKGDIEWVYLDERVPADAEIRALVPLEGIAVGIKHVGPVEAKRMGRELQAFKLQELRRVLAAREGLTEELAPQLWAVDPKAAVVVATPEGLEAIDAVLAKVLLPVVAGARGLHCESEPAAIVEELTRLGLLAFLVVPALGVQAVSAAQFPASADACVAEPGT